MLGIPCSYLWLYYGYHHLPLHVPPTFASTADKFIFTLKWQLPSFAVTSIIMFLLLLYKLRISDNLQRFVTNEDIFIWNTCIDALELFTKNTGFQLIVTYFIKDHQLKIIPLLTTLWVTGRLIYITGYLNPDDPNRVNRAFWFTLKWAPVGVLANMVRGQIPRLSKSLADKIPAIWSARTNSRDFLEVGGGGGQKPGQKILINVINDSQRSKIG